MTPWTVPLTEILLRDEDVAAVRECLRSGWLTMGPRIGGLEDALAEWTGAPHAVVLGSGTAALQLACRALGVGPGDEVIVPAFTFMATAHAVRHCGAGVVLCDSAGPHDPNLDLADVERRITPRTKAVVAVHVFGYPADAGALRELCDDRGLVLIEDAAQAIGARLDAAGRQAGTVGAAGCFSFFSKKQLPVGEGGALVCADEAVAAKVRSLRGHAMTSGTWDRHRGHQESYDIVDIGYNFRLDEPRAALALAQLPRLWESIAARRAAVRRYRERLRGAFELPWDDEDAVERSSHFAFAVLCAGDRDALRGRLGEQGIQTTAYPVLHALTEYAGHAAPGSLPHAEDFAARHVCLPLWAGMDEATVDQVCDALLNAS